MSPNFSFVSARPVGRFDFCAEVPAVPWCGVRMELGKDEATRGAPSSHEDGWLGKIVLLLKLFIYLSLQLWIPRRVSVAFFSRISSPIC